MDRHLDRSAPVSSAPSRAVDAAVARIDGDRLVELCAQMVDIASPTGLERPLAAHLRSVLDAAGLRAATQEVEGDLVNAYGTLPGRRAGDRLLLYAPIDTVTTGRAEVDLPWAGPVMRPDLLPRAEISDGVVVGLGAQNPKGHGACLLMAAEAITAAGVEPPHDLHIGFGGGGMPANAWAPGLPDGHGRGCRALVELLRPDHAVIAKTGWAVSWEEVGLTWFTVEVAGTHTYVGSRHLLPYRNAIADAGHVARGLEAWFETWAETNRSGLVAPQGVVAAVEGGWPHAAAFTTAVCRLHIDLRLSPRTPPEAARQAFTAEVERLAGEIGAEVRCHQGVTIPGTATAVDAPIVRCCIDAWEAMEGRSHVPIAGLSGATDANILRGCGIPTARVGLPKITEARAGGPVDFQLGMNAVDVNDLRRLTELLVRVALSHDPRPGS